nr:hypothetical protein L203_05828 [Cryptococcus depauperatus CBS 7841]
MCTDTLFSYFFCTLHLDLQPFKLGKSLEESQVFVHDIDRLMPKLSNAQELAHNVAIGTMPSIFSSGIDTVAVGQPFTLMEYHASCHLPPSLTFLLLPISLSIHNILHTPFYHATYTIATPSYNPVPLIESSRAAFIDAKYDRLPNLDTSEQNELRECHLRYHFDVRHWIPGALGSTHVSIWAKLDVEDSYYMGSFGETAGEEGLAETTQDQMMRDNMAQIVNMEDTNQLTL